MDVYLNQIKVASYLDFKEQPAANTIKNISLNGTLWVDVINQRRGWTIAFPLLKTADYTTIRTLYDNQFKASGGFINLSVPQLGLSTYVWMDVNEKYLRFNGSLVQGFIVTLAEQYAIS